VQKNLIESNDNFTLKENENFFATLSSLCRETASLTRVKGLLQRRLRVKGHKRVSHHLRDTHADLALPLFRALSISPPLCPARQRWVNLFGRWNRIDAGAGGRMRKGLWPAQVCRDITFWDEFFWGLLQPRNAIAKQIFAYGASINATNASKSVPPSVSNYGAKM